jgi:hypothetical protein
MAYVIRPTASIPIAVITVYVLALHRQWFLRYMGWAMLIALPWIAFNIATYGAILPSYYLGLSYAGEGSFSTALLGNLFSPSRGLFIYSPILLLSITGFVIAVREADERMLNVAYGMIVRSSSRCLALSAHRNTIPLGLGVADAGRPVRGGKRESLVPYGNSPREDENSILRGWEYFKRNRADALETEGGPRGVKLVTENKQATACQRTIVR